MTTKEVTKIAKDLNIKLCVLGKEYKKYFHSDNEPRWVFKLRLQRGRKSYTFTFGQSIASGKKAPTLYDVLACVQKYDVGTFDDFCSEYGYEHSKDAEKTYKAVCKEYNAIERLFTSDELQILQEIY
jgi:hypothetical protein